MPTVWPKSATRAEWEEWWDGIFYNDKASIYANNSASTSSVSATTGEHQSIVSSNASTLYGISDPTLARETGALRSRPDNLHLSILFSSNLSYEAKKDCAETYLTQHRKFPAIGEWVLSTLSPKDVAGNELLRTIREAHSSQYSAFALALLKHPAFMDSSLIGQNASLLIACMADKNVVAEQKLVITQALIEKNLMTGDLAHQLAIVTKTSMKIAAVQSNLNNALGKTRTVFDNNQDIAFATILTTITNWLRAKYNLDESLPDDWVLEILY